MKVYGVFDNGETRTNLGWMDSVRQGQTTEVTINGKKIKMTGEEIGTQDADIIPSLFSKSLQMGVGILEAINPSNEAEYKSIKEELAFLQKTGQIHVQIFREAKPNTILTKAAQSISHLLPPEKNK